MLTNNRFLHGIHSKYNPISCCVYFSLKDCPFFQIKIDKEEEKKKIGWIDKIELILELRDAYEKSGSLHVEKYITAHTQK